MDAEGVANVAIKLEPVAGQPKVRVEIEDDSPDGFAQLSHAWTLFAESGKKGDPLLRGRFNLGEKMVIALCDEARVITTSGGVRFDDSGRHSLRERRPQGSLFAGVLRATRDQYHEMCDAAARLIVPSGIKATFNGKLVVPRIAIASFEDSLQTEIADESGVLRRVFRKTRVNIHEPLPGEQGCVYELGVPVVETGDKFHYDVQQKVPLGFERDNVPPAFLRLLRVLALNATFTRLTQDDANQPWAREAAGDKHASDDAIRTMADKRFGERRVSYDPSDPEANSLAFSKGYTVVTGSQCSAGEWEQMRRAAAITSAGKVTPSPKPYSRDPNAIPEELLPESEWTDGMKRTAEYATTLARRLMGVDITVRFTRANRQFAACYGARELTFEVGCLGRAWFDDVGSIEQDDLLIHEFGHEYSSDHLSAQYHKALTMLAAQLKHLAIEDPELFERFRAA